MTGKGDDDPQSSEEGARLGKKRVQWDADRRDVVTNTT